jgi:hypothetical protein
MWSFEALAGRAEPPGRISRRPPWTVTWVVPLSVTSGASAASLSRYLAALERAASARAHTEPIAIGARRRPTSSRNVTWDLAAGARYPPFCTIRGGSQMMAAVAQIWSSRRQLPPDPSSHMAAWDGARKRTFRRAAGQWSRSSAGTGLGRSAGRSAGPPKGGARGPGRPRSHAAVWRSSSWAWPGTRISLTTWSTMPSGMSSCWPRGGRAALPRPGLLAKHALVSDSIPLWPAGSTAACSTVSPVTGVRRPPGGARFARLRTRGRQNAP